MSAPAKQFLLYVALISISVLPSTGLDIVSLAARNLSKEMHIKSQNKKEALEKDLVRGEEPKVYIKVSQGEEPVLHADMISHDMNTKTLLLIGSSLDRTMLQWACESASQRKPLDISQTDCVTDVCEIGAFKMAYALNYGVGEPPYWSTTPIKDCWSSGLCSHKSEDHIKKDLVAFSDEAFKGPPTLVLVESSLWDLANWWLRRGKPENSAVPLENITSWCHQGVPEVLGWVRAAFPKSKIAFRTPPTMYAAEYGRSPEALETMSHCIKEELRGKYDVLDYHAVVDDMLAEGWSRRALFKDNTHPSKHPALSFLSDVLVYMNKI